MFIQEIQLYPGIFKLNWNVDILKFIYLSIVHHLASVKLY